MATAAECSAASKKLGIQFDMVINVDYCAPGCVELDSSKSYWNTHSTGGGLFNRGGGPICRAPYSKSDSGVQCANFHELGNAGAPNNNYRNAINCYMLAIQDPKCSGTSFTFEAQRYDSEPGWSCVSPSCASGHCRCATDDCSSTVALSWMDTYSITAVPTTTTTTTTTTTAVPTTKATASSSARKIISSTLILISLLRLKYTV